jgi:hypothetical protein
MIGKAKVDLWEGRGEASTPRGALSDSSKTEAAVFIETQRQLTHF